LSEAKEGVRLGHQCFAPDNLHHYDIVGSFQVFVLFNFILYEKQLHKDEPSIGYHFDFENGFIFTCFIKYNFVHNLMSLLVLKIRYIQNSTAMEPHEEPNTKIRTTVFPMPIVSNAQDFSYNQRFGAQGRGAQGRGAVGRGAPRHGRNSSSTSVQPPLASSSRPNITRSIYILLHDTIWIDKGRDSLPFVESWPLDSPSVFVSLPSTTK
jgi:hypothetical protein